MLNDKFYVDFRALYPPGTRVEWMARAVRTKVKSQLSYNWAFHQAKFAEPDFSPNSTSNQFDYFTNTVQ